MGRAGPFEVGPCMRAAAGGRNRRLGSSKRVSVEARAHDLAILKATLHNLPSLFPTAQRARSLSCICKVGIVGRRSYGRTDLRRAVMMTIASLLVALSLLAGIAAPTNAVDGKSFWVEQARSAN